MKRVTKFLLTGVLMAGAFACTNKKNVAEEEFPSELVAFTPYENNPVFAGTGTDTWDKRIRERGYMLFEDGIYKLWYTGYNRDLAQECFLGYATSTDGVNWERYSENPVFAGKWTEDMHVLKEGETYYMYAEGNNDVAHLLTSADGIQWEEQGDLTILTTKGDTLPAPYGTPTVWVEDGEWYLFYEINDLAIWLAKSTDKITWTNIQDEPVLAPGPDQYDIGAVAADQIVKYNGKYYMYYHATMRSDWQKPNRPGPVLWNSNVAVSTDLIHWTKYPGNPLMEGDHSSPVLVFDGEKPTLYTMHPAVHKFSAK